MKTEIPSQEPSKFSGIYDDESEARTSRLEKAQKDMNEQNSAVDLKGFSQSDDYNSQKQTDQIPSSGELKAQEQSAQDHNDSSWKTKIDGLEQKFSDVKSLSGSAGGSAVKKKAAMIGAPVAMILLAVLAIFMFFGNLKAVHFATVLRSTGFAGSQLVMRKAFAKASFNAAVLSEDSVAYLDRPSRSMLDRLRRINPEKAMVDLGRKNRFKVVADSKNTPTGFDIKNQRFSIDDTAQETFGKNFKDLSAREKFTVKNRVLQNASDGLADVFSAESRTFNNSFFRGFRQYYNIRTSKWAARARSFLGKNADDALRLQREQTVVEIEDGDKSPIPKSSEEASKILDSEDGGAKSSINQVDESAKEVKRAKLKDIKDGLNKRTKDWVNEGFKKAGIDDVSAFSESAGKVSIAIFITTIYCTARDLDQSLSAINKDKEVKAQRFAHDIQTESDQIKNGHTVQAAVSAANKTWDGHDGQPGAEQSPFYIQATGGDPSGVPLEALDGIPTAKMAQNPIHDVFSTIDGVLGGGVASVIPGGTEVRDTALNGICSVALNPYAQGAVAGADIILSVAAAASSGGLTEIIKQTIKTSIVFGLGVYGGNELGEWLDRLIREWSGVDFSGAESGTDKFSAGAVATDSMNSQVGRGVTFGRLMTTEESKETKTAALNDLRTRYAKLPFKERVLAIDNPYSLTGKIAAISPASGSGMQQKIASIPSMLVTQFSNIFSGRRFASVATGSFGLSEKVYASSSADFAASSNFFGVEQWGWSQNEINIISNDQSYDILENASWVANNISQEESDKYQSCYSGYSLLDLPKECTNEFLSSEKALHWRVDKLYGSVINQLSGLDEGEGVPANKPDQENTISGGDSSNMTCSAGTDAGIGDGYKQGKLYKIRLCRVQGILVNAEVATNVNQMVIDAQKDGVRLSGGGFRTMATQIRLRAEHGCPNPNTPSSACKPPTARPGYSNHQMGLAIDFGNCGNHGTACWKWLNANAAKYGYKNFDEEPWHWSPDGK